ncbi:serine/threonine-protein kinase [Saccharothrix isguenensis]
MEDRTIAGRYRLTEKIGAGGMGVVWRAEDLRLRRIVAVKELLFRAGFDQESIDRAVREGRIAAKLQHANVIALYDVVEHDGHPWLVMEYLPSRSLSTLISERGTLPPDEVARLGVQLASGLAAAHRAGVVHRDVKPGNVLVTEFGTVKVTDFGTSRAADEVTVTASGMLVGTPAYLAPEVARGGTGGFPADVFALGSTLYAAVEGAPPFGADGNTIALLHRVADGRFPPPRNAGPLAPVLLRLLDTNPDTRPTMPEAADMLRDVRFDETPAAAPALPPPPPRPTAVMPAPVDPAPAGPTPADPQPTPQEQPRRDRKALVALAVVAVMAAVLIGYLVSRGEKGSPSAGEDGTTTETAQTTTVAAAEPADPTSEEPEQPPTTTAAETTTTAEAPVAVGPDQALADYYGLVPNDLETAYGRLTAGFKAARAPSFEAYRGFWDQMSAVTVSGVQVVGPNQVSASVSYTRKSGANEVERHVYTLVEVDGQWMIDGQS